MSKRGAAASNSLAKLLAALDDIVDQHMETMISIGDPISRYYRRYQQQQRIGIHGLLLETFQQLFSEKHEYAAFQEALAIEAFKWGERWAQAEIPKEVLLEVLYHLRLHVFQAVRETLADAEQKEELLSRLHEILNLRYHHTMRGYLTYKDQQISHLHQQKIGIIGQMAAGMAHEIHNPLTAINGFLQLMQTSVHQEKESTRMDAEQFSQYIQICQHEVQTLEQLVTSFLILARKNESVEMQNKRVELRSLLERVHELARHYVVEKDVQLSFHYDSEEYQVWAIPSYVEQIGLNLIKNAVDAVDSNGEVRVSLQMGPAGNHVLVRVEDNGCGIPEKRIKHLFEPFYTTKEKGTGMGLSVCKQLVEEMGGQIFVQSTVGEGTQIDIHFRTKL
ncbi:histidine kinase [Brevibacillus choshinensis]|uniref:histidine kinase n=1 Tax=Brevibacillus choshinensis TaxID=54911 RepID=A0ABR5N5M5_BRECH|nr:ATP-binding protein [Brevibacillus choshinensis]KQL45936.1 histidine kinase [Brevibacillus choshinensis]